MTEGFQGLGLDAVIRSDYENNDIGHIRSSSPHGGERFVTRSIEEGDRGLAPFDGVRTNVLCDASRFAGRHFGTANGIQKGGFSVIDVAHESDNGWTGFKIGRGNGFGFGRFHHGGDFVDAAAFLAFLRHEGEAAFFTDLFCNRFFDVLIQRGENVHLHEFMDQLERFQIEPGR